MLKRKAMLLLATTLVLVVCSGSYGAMVIKIAAGYDHTVALKSDGTVWTWGRNDYGQLGEGTGISGSYMPVEVSGLTGVTAVAAGHQYTLALRNDGTVWAWGYNFYGQLGDGTKVNRLMPVQVVGLSGVIAISAGGNHSIALSSDGTVWTWGYNGSGQLGDGTTTQRTTPVQVAGLSGVMAIAAGGAHSVALNGDGTVCAWGYNSRGQLGDGTTTDRHTPVAVPLLTKITAIAAGDDHTVALRSDRTARAWGSNDYGQLGDGTNIQRNSPAQVFNTAVIAAIAACGGRTVVVRIDGSVWAWGYNGSGELGDGTTISRNSRVQVLGISGAVAVAAGGSRTVALKSDGTLMAWGYNGDGGLGDGTTGIRSTPTQVIGFSGATAIAAGLYHTVALKSDGTVWTWGRNLYGELGDGTTVDKSIPTRVLGLSGVVAISSGNDHTVALKTDGTVWAWGYNDYGEIGDATTSNRTAPVRVLYISGITSISAGSKHTIALKNDGTVWAWGYNNSGQLGDGTTSYKVFPIQIPGLSGIVSIVAGGSCSIARDSDGRFWAWGDNTYGQLGDGTTVRSTIPVPISVSSGVAAIATSGAHTVVLKGNSTVWSWGYNYYGQLGDGTTTNQTTPVQALGLSGVTAIAAGGSSTMALRNDTTVWTWGYGYPSWLGAPGARITVPWQVPALSGVTAIAAGYNHMVALKSDTTVWAWGRDDYGQLGDRHAMINPLPLPVVGLNVVPPTGSVTINDGAASTTNAAVTLTLSATDEGGTITQMRVSDDGLFDTEPLEPYAPTKSWVLSPERGSKTIYVRFRSSSGAESETATASIFFDAIPPIGSFVINGGAAFTKTATVTLTSSVTDPNGTVTYMRISEDGVFDTEPLEPYAPTKSWVLSAVEGTRTIYVKFRSSSGADSETATASILFDGTAPTTPIVVADPLYSQGQDVTVTFSSTDYVGPITYLVKLDSGAYTPATSPIVYRRNVIKDGWHTVYVQAIDGVGNVSGGIASFSMLAPPVVSITLDDTAKGSTGNFLKGTLSAVVTATDITGVRQIDLLRDGTNIRRLYVNPQDGKYHWNADGSDPYGRIDKSWANGCHSITIRATDNGGVQGDTTATFDVNKNEVSGLIGLQGLCYDSLSRDVTFVLDGSDTRQATLHFINGVAGYSLTDVGNCVARISAKTPWSLRRRITGLYSPNGQTVADFTGCYTVLGGDLNGDNAVNALDYGLLRNSWGRTILGDITGDGVTSNPDYLIMKSNWYVAGDVQ